jgi:hypothetical protein
VPATAAAAPTVRVPTVPPRRAVAGIMIIGSSLSLGMITGHGHWHHDHDNCPAARGGKAPPATVSLSLPPPAPGSDSEAWPSGTDQILVATYWSRRAMRAAAARRRPGFRVRPRVSPSPSPGRVFQVTFKFGPGPGAVSESRSESRAEQKNPSHCGSEWRLPATGGCRPAGWPGSCILKATSRADRRTAGAARRVAAAPGPGVAETHDCHTAGPARAGPAPTGRRRDGVLAL